MTDKKKSTAKGRSRVAGYDLSLSTEIAKAGVGNEQRH